MLRIGHHTAIEDWELAESFTTARGPGGQNVNKVATAVELRFEAERSPHLPEAVKARLKRLAGRRWTLDGAVVMRIEDTRSQARNREIARERMAALVAQAFERPKPRRPTRPTLASKRRRVEGKVRRGALKAGRGPVAPDD